MHETLEDLARLQRLLDHSHERAGAHLRSIFTPERRLSAEELAQLLIGVNVLALGTVTSTCEPRVAPVDGLFHRGAFVFGSSPESVRFRHLRRNPAVSGTHTRGEALGVVVHGRARELDLGDAEHEDLVEYLHEVYPDWDEWAAGSPYAVIDAERLYTFADRDALGLSAPT